MSSGEGLVVQVGGLASRGLSEANRSFEVDGKLPSRRVGDEQGVARVVEGAAVFWACE